MSTLFVVIIVAIFGYLFYRYGQNTSSSSDVSIVTSTPERRTKGQEEVDKFVQPEDYERVKDFTKKGWYRSESLVRKGEYKKALNQLQVVYRAKLYKKGGVWKRAKNSICTLKRKLNKSLDGVDILDPEELTQYGEENIDRVCSILTGRLDELREEKGKSFIKDFTQENGEWYYGFDLDESMSYYKPNNEKIKEVLGRNWVQKAENEVRENDGLPKVGEGWVSETKLKNLVEKLVKPLKFEVIHRASPDWIGSQHLDIYVPGLDLAIEYMGRQHYEPVEFFGGEEGYEGIKKRDKVKKMKCTKNGVELIRYKYDEPMKPKHIAERICEKTELVIEDMDMDIDVPDEDELPSYRQ